MKIACIQVEMQSTLKKTFLRALSHINTINGSESIKILVLPDFTNFDDYDTIQEDTVEFIELLKEKALKHNQYILSGLLKYNNGHASKKQSFFINSLGEIVLNRFSQEKNTSIDKENRFPVIDSPFGKIGIVHDHELWVSEIPRIYCLKGAEILLVPCTNTPVQIDARINSIWGTSSLNCVIIAACSSTGKSQSLPIGRSIITSPDKILVQADNEEGIVIAEIENDYIQKVREPDLDFEKTLWWNLWNRKPELYGYLSEKEIN